MQYLALCSLRIAKIHHLVQKFVDDDEVVPYALFFELFEVFGEDFDDLVQEEEDFSGVAVAFRQGEEVEVVVSDVEVLGLRASNQPVADGTRHDERLHMIFL